MASSGLMTYSQFKSSRQNSMNGSSAKERPGAANQHHEEGEFEQVAILETRLNQTYIFEAHKIKG